MNNGIVIVKGDSTLWNGKNLLTVNLTADFDLMGFSAKLIVGSLEYDVADLTPKTFTVDFTEEQTSQLSVGLVYGTLILYDAEKQKKTFATNIPFIVRNYVIGEVALDSFVMDVTVTDGGQMVMEFDIKAGYDAENYYTKEETEALLDGKANISDVYTKQETQELLNNKADKSEVYTKSEIDADINVINQRVETLENNQSELGDQVQGLQGDVNTIKLMQTEQGGEITALKNNQSDFVKKSDTETQTLSGALGLKNQLDIINVADNNSFQIGFVAGSAHIATNNGLEILSKTNFTQPVTTYDTTSYADATLDTLVRKQQVAQAVSEITQTVGNLSTEVNDLNQSVENISQEVNSVKQNVDNLTEKIAELTPQTTLANNTIYRAGEMATLELLIPNSLEQDFICEVDFTSGATATAFTMVDTVKWTGDDIADGAFVPVANKRYNVILWWDSVNFNGAVRGV